MSSSDMRGILQKQELLTLTVELQKKLVYNAMRSVVPGSGILATETDDPRREQKYDSFLAMSVGPAAASAAIDRAITVCRKYGKLNNVAPRLNGDQFHNLHLIQNDSDDITGDYPGFSSVLRQFLLPRYAYLDFDRVVDPRHMIDLECGYPKFITPIMYRYMYDRDDVTRRVIDIYPDESWAGEPEIYDDEDEDNETEFERRWKELVDNYDLMSILYRMDKQAGIGHYGALLLGVDDGNSLEQPIQEKELLAGMRRAVSSTPRDLLYMRPFDEYLSFIHQYNVDTNHPRYGLPEYYNLVFLDMTIDAAGASIGTRLNRRVHWTRVVHIADNLQSSLVFGCPRTQPVFNRLLDLRKIKGGSGEMFWKGAFPGYSFEIDPRITEDDPDFDKEEFDRVIQEYSEGLSRYLRLVGVTAKSLAPQVADPANHVRIQLEAIACHFGVPFRVFLGSEESRLASSEDKLTWNRRLARRIRHFVNPKIIRNVVDRFIAIGIMPPPKDGRYKIFWPDLNTPTDEDKANLALKWTQAISQYVSSGAIHLISPRDFFIDILGLRPADALRIIKYAEKEGGFEKLKKVDPSMQGNGQQQNIAKDSNTGPSGGKAKKPDKSDSKVNGQKG